LRLASLHLRREPVESALSNVRAGIGPLMPLLYRLFPQYVTTTEQIGRAMLKAAKVGAPKAILETADINGM
jgi:hypothetical protein